MTIPTHLIMVLNRETFELKLVSAHLAGEAQAAFENLSSLFANTANDVHKVTVPSDCGFVIGEIMSSRGYSKGPNEMMIEEIDRYGARQDSIPRLPDTPAMTSGATTVSSRNGIHRNERGEYVQKLADGSEIISSSDFGDE